MFENIKSFQKTFCGLLFAKLCFDVLLNRPSAIIDEYVVQNPLIFYSMIWVFSAIVSVLLFDLVSKRRGWFKTSDATLALGIMFPLSIVVSALVKQGLNMQMIILHSAVNLTAAAFVVLCLKKPIFKKAW